MERTRKVADSRHLLSAGSEDVVEEARLMKIPFREGTARRAHVHRKKGESVAGLHQLSASTQAVWVAGVRRPSRDRQEKDLEKGADHLRSLFSRLGSVCRIQQG